MGCCPYSTARPSRGVLSAFYRLQPVGGGGGGGCSPLSVDESMAFSSTLQPHQILPVRTEPVPDEVREPGPYCRKRTLTLCSLEPHFPTGMYVFSFFFFFLCGRFSLST